MPLNQGRPSDLCLCLCLFTCFLGMDLTVFSSLLTWVRIGVQPPALSLGVRLAGLGFRAVLSQPRAVAHGARPADSVSVLCRGDEGLPAGHRAGCQRLPVYRLQAEEWPLWRVTTVASIKEITEKVPIGFPVRFPRPSGGGASRTFYLGKGRKRVWSRVVQTPHGPVQPWPSSALTALWGRDFPGWGFPTGRHALVMSEWFSG